MAPKRNGNPTITEKELRSIIDNKLRLQALKSEMKILEGLIETEETAILSLLENENVEIKGKLTAFVDWKKGSCRPPWKTEWATLIKNQGRDPEIAEEEVKKRYPANDVPVLMICPKDED